MEGCCSLMFKEGSPSERKMYPFGAGQGVESLSLTILFQDLESIEPKTLSRPMNMQTSRMGRLRNYTMRRRIGSMDTEPGYSASKATG
jgi:hypothetical protein